MNKLSKLCHKNNNYKQQQRQQKIIKKKQWEKLKVQLGFTATPCVCVIRGFNASRYLQEGLGWRCKPFLTPCHRIVMSLRQTPQAPSSLLFNQGWGELLQASSRRQQGEDLWVLYPLMTFNLFWEARIRASYLIDGAQHGFSKAPKPYRFIPCWIGAFTAETMCRSSVRHWKCTHSPFIFQNEKIFFLFFFMWWWTWVHKCKLQWKSCQPSFVIEIKKSYENHEKECHDHLETLTAPDTSMHSSAWVTLTQRLNPARCAFDFEASICEYLLWS